MVLLQADVPGQAAHSRHGLKLVDHAARDVIDVIVVELDAGVSDALAPQLVQLGIIHPLYTLRKRRLVQIQLQPLHNIRKVCCMETNHVFGDTRRIPTLSTSYSFQNSHSGSGLSLEPLPNMVGVCTCPVLEQHLSRLTRPR